MKWTCAPLAILTILFLSGCGGETHESLAGDGVSAMKEMVTILDGVKDEATATAAKPKLQALMEKLNGINDRQSKLPAPTEAELKAMDAKYGKEMEQTAMKLQGNMMRVMTDPKISAVLADIDMKKMH